MLIEENSDVLTMAPSYNIELATTTKSPRQRCDDEEKSATPTTTMVTRHNDKESDGLRFHSYRTRILRKGSLKNHLNRRKSFRASLHAVTASTPFVQQSNTYGLVCTTSNDMSKITINPIDRVSPTSIADLHHQDSKLLFSESYTNMVDSRSFDSDRIPSPQHEYVTELDQLHHSLTRAQDNDFVIAMPLSSEKTISLVRTCTPRDTLFADSDIAVVESIATEIQYLTGQVVDSNEVKIGADAKPLRRFCSFPTPWTSLTIKCRAMNVDEILGDDMNDEKNSIQMKNNTSNLPKERKKISPALKKRRSLPLSLTAAPPSPLNVTFNEMMEVRFFYRSDDEIAIMKQCAMERRVQMESRRRLRRRLRKDHPPSLLIPLACGAKSSSHFKNSFISLFGNSWTIGQEKCSDILDEDSHYDTPRQRGILHCGIPFACYDDGDDSTNENVIISNDVMATTAIDHSTKSTPDSLVKPVPKSTGVTPMKQECSNNDTSERKTVTSANNFLYDLVNGLSGMMLIDDMFNDHSTSKHEDSKEATIIVDQVSSSPDTLLRVMDDTPNVPWMMSALTCGTIIT